ncbi:amidophosphoribosyltransferase [Sphingomonas panacis]|uniref:Amidophosphoribosyltransferase n=1 Tax=Sphingomonas panacis TaxID=1560345 RepID=A0A1B3ZD70_9SPHN|nr:ComF family protein [Sphingomonas panacis]AOH85369.1 amidophosphoribosyltransferase [Sphingomonas panacis]
MSPLAAPLQFVAGLALPPRCPGCGAVTGEDHRFCATCWGALRFLAPPWCATCQVPFEHEYGISEQCADCLAAPPRHAGVFAAVAYGDIARTVALRLKYGGRIAFAETVGRQMARLMPAGADLIVPVPLHRWRLWSRGFNQAALIATSLARASGVPTDPLALRRTRATPMLRGLGVTARARAVKGAFAVSRPERVAGKAVALVDDIYTSGATTDACTAALLAAGATSVAILCWARVLDSDGT